MAVLQFRLDQLEIARQAQMNAEHTQSLHEISWGNQIRSYVLHVSFYSYFELEMVAALPRMASVWSAYVQMALIFFLSRLVKRGSYRLGWVL